MWTCLHRNMQIHTHPIQLHTLLHVTSKQNIHRIKLAFLTLILFFLSPTIWQQCNKKFCLFVIFREAAASPRSLVMSRCNAPPLWLDGFSCFLSRLCFHHPRPQLSLLTASSAPLLTNNVTLRLSSLPWLPTSTKSKPKALPRPMEPPKTSKTTTLPHPALWLSHHSSDTYTFPSPIFALVSSAGVCFYGHP